MVIKNDIKACWIRFKILLKLQFGNMIVPLNSIFTNNLTHNESYT